MNNLVFEEKAEFIKTVSIEIDHLEELLGYFLYLIDVLLKTE